MGLGPSGVARRDKGPGCSPRTAWAAPSRYPLRSCPSGTSLQAPDLGGLRSRPGAAGLATSAQGSWGTGGGSRDRLGDRRPRPKETASLLANNLSRNFDPEGRGGRPLTRVFSRTYFKILYLNLSLPKKCRDRECRLLSGWDRNLTGGCTWLLPRPLAEDPAPPLPGSRELGDASKGIETRRREQRVSELRAPDRTVHGPGTFQLLRAWRGDQELGWQSMEKGSPKLCEQSQRVSGSLIRVEKSIH